MVSVMCVCQFVHTGRGGSPPYRVPEQPSPLLDMFSVRNVGTCDSVQREGVCGRHPPPSGRHPHWADPPQSDTPSQADTPCPVHAGIHTDGHCSGRYASYWNAFLLNLFKLDLNVQGPCPPPQFKLVHYLVRPVIKRAVGIRLKCLLIAMTIFEDTNISRMFDKTNSRF